MGGVSQNHPNFLHCVRYTSLITTRVSFVMWSQRVAIVLLEGGVEVVEVK